MDSWAHPRRRLADSAAAALACGAVEPLSRRQWRLLALAVWLAFVAGFAAGGVAVAWLLLAVGPPGRLTGPVPTRWQGRLPRGVPPGRLALLSGEAQDQLESALAQLQGCRRSYDRPPKGAVGHGDVATTAQDRSWAASGWLPYGLELDMADGRRGTSSESLEDLQARCVKPAKQVFLGWSYVDSLPPVVINNCMSIPITELIYHNAEALHLSIVPIAAGGELLLLTEQKGSIYVLNIENDGNYPYFDTTRPYVRFFKGASCLNSDLLCNPQSATALNAGFLTVDQHRVQEFNFTWGSIQEPTELAVFGRFNQMYAENEPLRQYTHLKFPATSVVYESYNSTHINDTVRITPLCPHAAERFLFVADVGNNRITVLWKVRAHSASLVSPPFPSDMGGNVGFRYAGQFGETMVPHDDEHGMTLPWGMAVQAPAWEYPSEPVIANVFVVDKLTNRLIKLDFRYDAINSDGRSVSEWPYPAPDSYPRLVYSGEYSVGAHDNESLWEPMGVALFRHYIFVAEAQGNTIKVFTLHYSDTRAFKLVTVLYPAQGIQLTGTIAVSPIRYYDNGQSASRLGGYLWYTYHRDWTDWEMGSFFLEEALRLSTKPEEYKDFVDQCVDASTYHAMLQQGVPHFLAEVDRLCNIAHVNCRYPSSPDYVDPQLFNWTVFELQNATVFDEVSFSTCVYGYWFVGAELDEDIYPNLTVDDLVTNPNLTAELKEFTSNYWEERCFNLDVLNATIFNGRMGLCPTSAAPTPAPQDSGDDWPLVASATSRGSTSSPNAAGGAWRWRLAACLLAASWSASARASCR